MNPRALVLAAVLYLAIAAVAAGFAVLVFFYLTARVSAAPRSEPPDPPIAPVPSILFLVDDAGTGYACDLLNIDGTTARYVGTRLEVHAIACTAERIFSARFEP